MPDEKELFKLYRDRVNDFTKAKTKRRKSLEHTLKPVGSILFNYFSKEAPQALNKIEENRALLAWPKYVGSVAAKFSQALRISNETLTIKVADNLWMQQLLLVKHELLKKYRRDFPKLAIKDIFFTRYDKERLDLKNPK